MVTVDSEELKELVSSTIRNIEDGMKGKDYRLHGDIEFEVAVVTTSKAEGRIKLLVVGADGKLGQENVTKIKFKVTKKTTGIGPIIRTI